MMAEQTFTGFSYEKRDGDTRKEQMGTQIKYDDVSLLLTLISADNKTDEKAVITFKDLTGKVIFTGDLNGNVKGDTPIVGKLAVKQVTDDWGIMLFPVDWTYQITHNHILTKGELAERGNTERR